MERASPGVGGVVACVRLTAACVCVVPFGCVVRLPAAKHRVHPPRHDSQLLYLPHSTSLALAHPAGHRQSSAQQPRSLPQHSHTRATGPRALLHRDPRATAAPSPPTCRLLHRRPSACTHTTGHHRPHEPPPHHLPTPPSAHACRRDAVPLAREEAERLRRHAEPRHAILNLPSTPTIGERARLRYAILSTFELVPSAQCPLLRSHQRSLAHPPPAASSLLLTQPRPTETVRTAPRARPRARPRLARRAAPCRPHRRRMRLPKATLAVLPTISRLSLVTM